jgi:hypothetical protein
MGPVHADPGAKIRKKTEIIAFIMIKCINLHSICIKIQYERQK